MKRSNCIRLLFVLLFLFTLPCLPDANAQKKVRLKFGTLAPRGTSVSAGVELMQNMFNYAPFQKLMGTEVKYKMYWGGIMGDEPQMIQKAKMGQLDVITISLNSLSLVCKELEPLAMAYLLTDYGEFDYVMSKTKKFINDAYYKNGWIVLNLCTTEGVHNFYIPGPYKTPEELKKNIIAGNYSGEADDTFYKALGIPQTAVQPSDAFVMFKQGLVNGGLTPSIMVVGMQMYIDMKYMVTPCIRMSPNGFAFPRRRWDTLPGELKAFYIVMQPFLYYGAGGMMRDSANAYTESLLKYGVKELKLSPKELKVWKDRVVAYRKTYLGNDKKKIELYNMIMKAKEEYKKGKSLEEAIYKKDKKYKYFVDGMRKLGKALATYQKNGSLKKLKSLEKQRIIENWRIYGWLAASEHYMKTGKTDRLKKWMKSFFNDKEVDKLFTKDAAAMKKVFGSRKNISAILGSFRQYLETDRYKGFQKTGGAKISRSRKRK